MLERETIKLPADWSAFLLLGDDRGLGDTELRHATAALHLLHQMGWKVVSCSGEKEYTAQYRLYHFAARTQTGEIREYTITRRKRD
jgi:hypothetical protein